MKNIYRAGALGLAALSLAGFTASAQTETVLYRFTGGNDGAHPFDGVIAEKEGALYGTTNAGGDGYGTIFKLTPPTEEHPAWTETVLWSFCQSSVPCIDDGTYPEAGLMSAPTVRSTARRLKGATAAMGRFSSWCRPPRAIPIG